MKQGKTIQELAAEVYRHAQAKKDFVASTSHIAFKVQDAPAGEGDTARRFREILELQGVGNFEIGPVAHRQIGDRLGIPARYYDRMRTEAPDLLSTNVNHWMHQTPDTRLIRTLDGRARAFLSNRYRILDNEELLEHVVQELAAFPDLEIKSAEVSDSRLYLKAVTPRITGEIKPGDQVQAGIVISNSEVGLGSFRVEPLIYRLVCSNGMIAADYGLLRPHIGRQLSADERAAAELFSDETRRADDHAFWLKARDIVRGVLQQDVFADIVARMRAAGENRITGDPVKAVEQLTNKNRLTEGEKNGVLLHLLSGGDLSQLGMVNAVTRASQDAEEYERATELERLGGNILALNKKEWAPIATAA